VSSFRLALLNPNTTAGDTEAMVSLARSALPADAAVDGFTASEGHAAIESDVEHVAGAAQVVAMRRTHGDYDAYLVACFDDPGLDAAREIGTAPVVGIGHAAYLSATLIGRRFAVITTLRRGVPALQDAIRGHGLAARCAGVVALERGVREQGGEDAVGPLVDAGTRALEELGADTLVLACGAMASTSRRLSEQLAVPVCDGVGFGAGLAHTLWSNGLSTSKHGGYGWPEGHG
jgi:allantoin racemase